MLSSGFLQESFITYPINRIINIVTSFGVEKSHIFPRYLCNLPQSTLISPYMPSNHFTSLIISHRLFWESFRSSTCHITVIWLPFNILFEIYGSCGLTSKPYSSRSFHNLRLAVYFSAHHLCFLGMNLKCY